jgi:hypothetical protein
MRKAMPTPIESADIPTRVEVMQFPEAKDPAPSPVAPAPSRTAEAPPVSNAQLSPTTPVAEYRPDVRPIVRALIEQAIAPLERTVRELQQRLQDLERRPTTAAVTMPATTAAPAPVAARAFAARQAHASPAATMPSGQALDVAAIERTVRLDPEIEAAFSGRRRRLRGTIAVVLLFVVLFGGLFAALAQSYTHAHG